MRRLSFCLVILLVLASCAAPSRTHWERQLGGLAPESPRANAALQRIAGDRKEFTLRVAVLNNGAPVAFSYPDGALYVSTGLMTLLSDDELAAALAHEIGHLIIAGHMAATSESPVALTGYADSEKQADALAVKLLVARQIPTETLISTLQKVADASRGTPFCDALHARIAALQN